MSIRFDDKGKFFTDRITKDSFWATIQTVTHRIRGQVYVQPDGRLKDELNQSEQFIAVTNAVVFDLSGGELYRCQFLTLNRDHVVWIIPNDQMKGEQAQEGGEA